MNQKALFAVVVAAMLMGTSGAFVKWVQLPPTSLSCIRLVVPALLAFAIAKIRYGRIHAPSQAMLLGGLLNAIRLVLFMVAFQLADIGKVVLVLYTWPIYATFFSIFVLKEKIASRNLTLLALPVSGLLLIFSAQEISIQDDGFLGLLVMFFSAGIYALSITFFKKDAHKFAEMEIIFYQNAMGAVVFLPFLLINRPFPNSFQWGGALTFTLGVGILAFALFFWGLKRLKASTASFLAFLEILVATAMGVLFFEESLTWQQVSGGSLILLSSFLLKKE